MIIAVRIEEAADVDRRLRLVEMRVGDRAVGVQVDERRGQAIEAALFERPAELRQTNRLALRIHKMLVRVEQQAPAIHTVDVQQQLDPIDAVARVLVASHSSRRDEHRARQAGIRWCRPMNRYPRRRTGALPASGDVPT